MTELNIHDRCEKASFILRNTDDGASLLPGDLSLVEMAINGGLDNDGIATFVRLYEAVEGGTYVHPWFHDIENMTIGADGFVYWKGDRVDHYTRPWAFSVEGKVRAVRLAQACRSLENAGLWNTCSVLDMLEYLQWSDSLYPFSHDGSLSKYQKDYLNREYRLRCRDASGVKPADHLENLLRDLLIHGVARIKEDGELELEYPGFAGTVNVKPDTGICVWISDWNKDFWGVYAWVDSENYAEDIEQINKLVSSLNWRDGDVYYERIDYEGDTEHLYASMKGYDSEPEVLNAKRWEVWEDKGEFHFGLCNALCATCDLAEYESSEFVSYDDWEDALRASKPDLAKALDDANEWCNFDSEQAFNGMSISEHRIGEEDYIVEMIS